MGTNTVLCVHAHEIKTPIVIMNKSKPFITLMCAAIIIAAYYTVLIICKNMGWI